MLNLRLFFVFDQSPGDYIKLNNYIRL